MTVDVEDYFHVQAFADVIDRSDWERFPCRIERNIKTLLGLFDEHGVGATYFILGWVAERYPETIKQIAAAGHEIASHGWEHQPVDRQTPEVFREDCRRAKALLEDLVGAEVQGYRAASFSINESTPWAHKILKAEGYRYSSSIYPILHDHYGSRSAPRFAFAPSGPDGVVELPISTINVMGHNFPCGGGGYFRLFPFSLSRWALERVNRVDGQSCMFFLHPWEIDPDQPRQHRAGVKSRFRHYLNLRQMEPRLRRLLASFSWDRVDRVYKAAISEA